MEEGISSSGICKRGIVRADWVPTHVDGKRDPEKLGQDSVRSLRASSGLSRLCICGSLSVLPAARALRDG